MVLILWMRDTVDADTVDTADGAVEGCFDGFLLMSHRAYEHDPVLYNCLRERERIVVFVLFPVCIPGITCFVSP